jgi:hypothetical protein
MQWTAPSHNTNVPCYSAASCQLLTEGYCAVNVPEVYGTVLYLNVQSITVVEDKHSTAPPLPWLVLLANSEPMIVIVLPMSDSIAPADLSAV